MVRSKQPDIIINNRSGIPGDLETPEQHIQSFKRPWETCMTMDDLWWGYHPGDPNVKTPMQLVRNLARCVGGNGNFLLNVGPRADGTIAPIQAARLRAIGRWMKSNGESIYGAGPSPFGQAHLGHVTAKGNTVYIHVCYWPGRQTVVAGIANRVLKAYMLATGRNLPFDQQKDRLFVQGLPSNSPDPIDTVIALEIEGKPETMPASFWK